MPEPGNALSIERDAAGGIGITHKVRDTGSDLPDNGLNEIRGVLPPGQQ